MPRVDEGFLAGFARGLFALADAHGIELVGGDTTAGPLNLCITVFGEVLSRWARMARRAFSGFRWRRAATILVWCVCASWVIPGNS